LKPKQEYIFESLDQTFKITCDDDSLGNDMPNVVLLSTTDLHYKEHLMVCSMGSLTVIASYLQVTSVTLRSFLCFSPIDQHQCQSSTLSRLHQADAEAGGVGVLINHGM
jgi:hypothetical protein